MTVTRATNSAGHSLVERNAPKPMAATTRPPTISGMTSTERIPARRLYSTAAAASGGASWPDRTTIVRPARSSLANQLSCAGTGPRAGGSTPSTATEHRKYCSSPTNSQKAQRSKPRNSRSSFSAPSSSSTTRSPATLAKRAETSESRRSNARSSWSDGSDTCLLGVAPPVRNSCITRCLCREKCAVVKRPSYCCGQSCAYISARQPARCSKRYQSVHLRRLAAS